MIIDSYLFITFHYTQYNMADNNIMKQTIKSFDDIYDVIGGFGTYQVILLTVSLLVSALQVETIYLNFVLHTQEHWCYVPELRGLPFENQRHVAIPKEAVAGTNQDEYSQCYMYDMNYTLYSDEESLIWNRSDMSENSTLIPCDSWVYDQSVMLTSFISDVSMNKYEYYIIQMKGGRTLNSEL